MKITKYLMLGIMLVTTISGCQNKKKDEDISIPVTTLYNKGLDYLQDDDYKKAAEEFGQAFYQDPGHEMTSLAEIMQAYTLYKQGEYEDAIDVTEIFLKLHPRNQYVDYIYYLRALCYYAQISDVELDQSKSENALTSLNEIVYKFPNSNYASDANTKIDLVLDHLAAKEMLIGRYYLNKQNPIAAIKRFQKVITDYNMTLHVPEAFYRLVESNIIIGLNSEASKYYQVLKSKYPDNEWTAHSHKLIK